MGALVGRQVLIYKGSVSPQTLVAAGRTKSVTINAQPIDITSDDDSGWRTLLEDEPALLSVDFSFEGITKDDAFLAAIMGGNYADDYAIVIGDICQLEGRFFITSNAVNAPYNDATTFSAQAQSTGEIGYSTISG